MIYVQSDNNKQSIKNKSINMFNYYNNFYSKLKLINKKQIYFYFLFTKSCYFNSIKFYLFILFLIINTFFTCSLSAGIFELQIIKYENLNLTLLSLHEQQKLVKQNNDLFSKMFNRPLIRPSLTSYSLNLVYNLCLKEAKAKLLSPPCTFGEITSSSTSMNIPVTMRKKFTFRWTKSVTMILTILQFKEFSSELKPIDKHVHFDEQIIPINSSMLFSAYSWIYKNSQTAFSKLVYRFRVQCEKNYFGEDCSLFCRPRNDTFGHYKCSEEGEQYCLEGWQGTQCNKTICSQNCSTKNGYCEKPGECRCKPGYDGETCEQCVVYPGCLNGYCQQPWQCICLPGWGGIFCDQDLNFCGRHQPCINGGICTNVAPNKYQCQCKPGFSGTNCETIINPCSINPCLNGGTCKYLNKSVFHCECQAEWTGERCELNLNECLIDSPCGKNGVCIDLIDGFECQCNEGFTGKFCNKNINECEKLEDTCVIGNTFKCIDTIGSFNCECLSGFGGKHCETNFDDCEKNPCQNQARCIDLINDYQCDCIKGFKGKNCSQMDESVCEHFHRLDNLEEQSKLLEETKNDDIQQNLFFKDNEQYWQIIDPTNQNLSSCKTKWCTCNNENKISRLFCICINEDEYNLLNQKQLEKLDLVKTAQKIILTDSKNNDQQQNYFLDNLSQQLQNLAQVRKNNKYLNTKIFNTSTNLTLSKAEASTQLIQESSTSSNIKIYEVLIDQDQDLDSDDLFVSLTITLKQTAKTDQVENLCLSMLAIYSLICNQPQLDKLNFACKLKPNNSIQFYTLDNDERVLTIGDILQKTLYSKFILTIVKRTYKLTNLNHINEKRFRFITVISICIFLLIFILCTMICIIYVNDNLRKSMVNLIQNIFNLQAQINSNNHSFYLSENYNNLNIKKNNFNTLNNSQQVNQFKLNNLISKPIKLNNLNNQFNQIKFNQIKFNNQTNDKLKNLNENHLEKIKYNEKLELNNFKLLNLNNLNYNEYNKLTINLDSNKNLDLKNFDSNKINSSCSKNQFKSFKFAQL